MKKLTKSLIAIACVATLGGGVAAMSACNNEEPKNGTGEAYALVHTSDSVGYAKLVYEDGKITDAVLGEACLPTQVQAGADVAEADKVEGVIDNHGNPGSATYYKTVAVGSTTFTYDATISDGYSKGYVTSDGTAIKVWLQTEANAKAYYEAVVNNNISVTVGDTAKKDVLTKAKLFKDDNGYGGTSFNWKGNRDATLNYVKEYGTAKLNKLTKNDDKVWTDGSVVLTGATWSDLYGANADNKASGANAITYVQLILNADKAVK